MRNFVVVMAMGLLMGGSQKAFAQGSPDDRVYLNIGFGVESGSTQSADSKQYTLYDEPATTNAAASWTSGSLFGGGIDFRVVKNFTVGVSYHQETNTSESILTGTVPHPVFFNRSRTFDTKASGLYRRENATHLSFGWIVPVMNKLDVLVSGGPSFFRLQQDVVSDVTIAERGGTFTEVVVAPTVVTQKRSATGYNVAADVTYLLWQNDSVRLGAGGFIRYTSAKSNVRLLVSDIDTTIGGIQFGFGARIRF
ncbi:MAG: hypothetical protein Q8N51_16190 [Gammaproteobacteria bacterium]|nr:hypothetical protein [Gammaproteobacteria bacterium]